MKRSITALAVVVAVPALAACGGGGSPSDSPPPRSRATTPTVSVEEIEDSGRVLVNSTGKALVRGRQEEADSSVVCTGACTSFWIPVTTDGSAPSGNSLPGELGVVERGDGTRQVTFDREAALSVRRGRARRGDRRRILEPFDGHQFTWHVVSVGEPPTRVRGATAPAARLATRRLVVACGGREGARQVHPRRCGGRPAMGPPPGRPHRNPARPSGHE